LERFLSESGAVRALMTGSGPTVFGIFEDKEKAQRALDGLNDRYPDFQRFLTEFVWPEEL
ncbi:MAG: 4-(cytidine 5'-diphospho)-2-C-methyl-D-erythritol kinase, partial [Lachnospiraceae bacterium]|nr:4-(cytidine 5'-diphospho)-2-C-methyl-D-erythritol kinase [Lachnospiraceae bacterium]